MARQSTRARKADVEISWLIAASILTFALWVLPMTRPFMMPVVVLNTHLHELAHALAGIGTGGRVSSIQVFADGSGLAHIYGGQPLVVAQAGYVGAAMIGGLLIAASREIHSAQIALRSLAVLMAFSMVLFVRGDLIGLVSGWLWTLLLFLLAWRLEGPAAAFTAAFLGLQQALTSVYALLTLLELSVATERMSDAQIMEQLTGLPSMLWALGWTVVSAVAVGLGFKSAVRAPARNG